MPNATVLSDGTWVYRGASVPAGAKAPFVLAIDHTHPSAWEQATFYLEACDQLGVCVAIPDLGTAAGVPQAGQEVNCLNGNPATFIAPGGATSTVTWLGVVAWAAACGADPMTCLGTGWSEGTFFWTNYANNNNDPASFSVKAIQAVSGYLDSTAWPTFTRTQKQAFWGIMGSNDSHGWKDYTRGDGHVMLAAQHTTERWATLNGWTGAAAVVSTPYYPASLSKPYVVEWKYPTSGGPETKYWILTAGNYPTILSPSEPGGGQHYWPMPAGSGTVQGITNPTPSDTAFNATTEGILWFLNTVLGGSSPPPPPPPPPPTAVTIEDLAGNPAGSFANMIALTTAGLPGHRKKRGV